MESDPRSEASHALKEGRADVFVRAVQTTVGYIGLCVALGGGLIAVGMFNSSVLAGMSLGSVGAFAGACWFFDVRRLERCRAALQELLRTDRSGEDLLREARRERDEALKQARDESNMRSVIQAQMAAMILQLRLPAQQEPENDQAPVQTSAGRLGSNNG